MQKSIVIKGAREHNLKNLSLTIPRDKLVVITGLSGSGKSSLAFDTVYAEGQRRYLESLSAYARQFMEQMKKPAVNSIDGLSPSISIEQKNISRNPRSTVGTVTEIYDFLRLLYARIGKPHCPQCARPIQTQTVQQIVGQILDYPKDTKFAILAPIARGKKGEFQKELTELRRQGLVRALIDGEQVDLSGPIKLKKNLKHDISVYVDRLVLKPNIEGRLTEAVELAVSLTGGMAEMEVVDIPGHRFFSTKFACVDCGISLSELEPRSFSFNSPHGACPNCDGLGVEYEFDPKLIITHPEQSLLENAVEPWEEHSQAWKKNVVSALGDKFGFDPKTPFRDLPEDIREKILHGSPDEEINFTLLRGKTSHQFKQAFEGIIPALDRQLDETTDEWEQYRIEKYLSPQTCEGCNGARLRKESLSVLIDGKNISQFCEMDVESCQEYLKAFKPNKTEALIAAPVLKEISARLKFLSDVGLPYLTLSRSAATLSGGEAQRIRLATQIGSHLVGVLYILDEPSIGLHQRDNEKLIQTLERLRDLGNTVIVVEHDEETIRRADFLIDIGPGAGEHGGEITFIGEPSELGKSTSSLTAQYMQGTRTIPEPTEHREVDKEKSVQVLGAAEHNLKNVDAYFPLGCFICVTGVSGSGKSTLIIDTLLEGVQAKLSREERALRCREIRGLEQLDKVIHVDQNPIGRTPRSNPATYTGTFTEIRNLFASLPSAKVRGYKPSRFSFNVPGGRCEACKGDGTIKIAMNFLPAVFVACEVCQGRRYNRETLQVNYRGKNIGEVLDMSIEHAAGFFERIPRLKAKLDTLIDVGLGYVKVGQSAVTVSGGEAQRIKLARELTKRATGRTLYILDEPTTGLHFEDVKKLMEILHQLVDQGNTVVVIEHHLDVIKQGDYLIDLGPEGGAAGGNIVAQGTVADICDAKDSYTGSFLKKILSKSPNTKSARRKKPTAFQPASNR
ncbi:MAG: excinuclease ABC subunit UvrA [Bdellovibrionota bacterium]